MMEISCFMKYLRQFATMAPDTGQGHLLYRQIMVMTLLLNVLENNRVLSLAAFQRVFLFATTVKKTQK